MENWATHSMPVADWECLLALVVAFKLRRSDDMVHHVVSTVLFYLSIDRVIDVLFADTLQFHL